MPEIGLKIKKFHTLSAFFSFFERKVTKKFLYLHMKSLLIMIKE